MDIPLDPKTRIFIIEGVAGSGKSTLQQLLQERLSGKLIYSFSEEELLFSWKHAWIKGIDRLRLDLMDAFLTYMEGILNSNPKAVFILDRFHLSFYYIETMHLKKHSLDSALEKRYAAIIRRLQKLPVHVYIPLLKPGQIELRSVHAERKDKTWQLHLKRRLETSGHATLTELYVATQDFLLDLAEKQGIPYTKMDAL